MRVLVPKGVNTLFLLLSGKTPKSINILAEAL